MCIRDSFHLFWINFKSFFQWKINAFLAHPHMFLEQIFNWTSICIDLKFKLNIMEENSDLHRAPFWRRFSMLGRRCKKKEWKSAFSKVETLILKFRRNRNFVKVTRRTKSGVPIFHLLAWIFSREFFFANFFREIFSRIFSANFFRDFFRDFFANLSSPL